MAIHTTLSVTLTKQFMLDLGFTVDEQGRVSAAPKGIWASAIWFANNDTDKGYLQLIDNGAALNPTPVLDSESKVTGFKFNIPAFTQDALKGGVMYIALASDSSLSADPFANLTEGLINNLQRAQTGNFTFGTFEFTLQGGAYDAGDLTAISTFGLPMSATAIVGGASIGSVGFKVPGSTIWSDISALGTVDAPVVYPFDAAKGPLTSDAFAVTPTTAVGGSFKPPEGKTLPFSSTDWDAYLDKLASVDGVIAQVGGTFNGAAAPVKNWQDGVNTPINVWHNAGFFDYEVSYKSALSVQVDGKHETIGAFLLSPTVSSQVKGYIVIPKGDEPGLAAGWEGGLANSIYSTLGMAQVYAQDPSVVSGQTPHLFQHATIDNNGSASKPANTEFFNVGANTQWGKVFTQLLTGFAAGYVGSTGTALNPLQTDGTVDLSKSWNWDPTYAFEQNLATKPYGTGPSFQFTDNYAKIFFQNSNVYGDMYSDNLMSLFTTGSPLLPLSKNGVNVDEVNVTIFSVSDTPTGYVSPTINNYPWGIGNQPKLADLSTTTNGTFTLNFGNPAGADGQQSFVVDQSRVTLEVKVWDPTLNGGKGAFSNSAELPAFPVAQVTVSGIAGQEVPQGTVLTTIDAQQNPVQWTVVSSNNSIPAENGTLNGSVKVQVTASSPDASITKDTTWQDVTLAFPGAVSSVNSAASIPGQTAQDPSQVTIRFSGDAGARFEAGYIVDAANHRWTFAGGTINSTTGFVDVVATASAAGVSVGANEAWKGLFQNSPVTTESASTPGVFWSDYTASYADGELSFVNQNVTTQPTGILQLSNLPLGSTEGDFVWYQLTVTDIKTDVAKTFNFYPQSDVITPNSQYIDGGASIALGKVNNQYTINFAGSGVDPLPSSLFIPDQTNGRIPLQGTPDAPVIGTQSETYYQYLGQSVNFSTAVALDNKFLADSYVFGWTGLNPASVDDGSISKWTNKANGLDIVQINITDTLDASRNTKVFAQADLDGQWLTGLSSIINPIGADVQLISKPVSLVAGRSYQITSQEFSPTDSGLHAQQPSGIAPIGNLSEALTVVVAGTSGMLETENSELNDFVYSLYDGILDRVPDKAGFFYWADEVLNTENGRSVVLSNVMLSDEFQASWSNLTDEQLVKTAYAFVLNRAPDAAGEQYWLAELNSGMLTQQQLLQSFIDSAESVQITDSITQNGYLAMF